MRDLDDELEISNDLPDSYIEDVYGTDDFFIDFVDDDRYYQSNRMATALVLSFMGACAYIVDAVLQKFPIYDLPYTAVIDFYKLTLAVPAQSFPKVWSWLMALGLTDSDSVNTAISVSGIFIYWVLVLELYAVCVEHLGIMLARIQGYDQPDIAAAFKLYLMPGLLCLLYFLSINLIAIW